MWKRAIAAFAGLVYAVIYGFWTILQTGGGHGNFIWMILFFAAYFFGLFFPIMGALVVDLRSIIAKATFGSLIFISLLIHLIIIIPILSGSAGASTTDFQKTWARDPSGTVVGAIIHLLPLFGFLLFLAKSIFFVKKKPENDETVGLLLN